MSWIFNERVPSNPDPVFQTKLCYFLHPFMVRLTPGLNTGADPGIILHHYIDLLHNGRPLTHSFICVITSLTDLV